MVQISTSEYKIFPAEEGCPRPVGLPASASGSARGVREQAIGISTDEMGRAKDSGLRFVRMTSTGRALDRLRHCAGGRDASTGRHRAVRECWCDHGRWSRQARVATAVGKAAVTRAPRTMRNVEDRVTPVMMVSRPTR